VKYFLIFVTCAVLSACNSVGMSTAYKGNDAGYVVAGIGSTPDSNFQNYSLIFKNIVTGQKGSLIFMQGSILKESPQYSDEFGVGVVKVASLPAGKYEFINYSAFSGNGMTGGTVYSAKEDFSIPFEVKPGGIIYLGNYQALVVFNETALGIKVSHWNGFKVRDASKHDLSIAQKANHNISAESFINVTPDVIKIAAPSFK